LITTMQPSKFRFAQVDDERIRWYLARNCSITPRQLGAIYASLCVISLVISLGFWWQGATLVAPFAVLELALLAVAFLAYARHATDAEHIVLDATQLHVEVEHAGECRRSVFPREWVRIHHPEAHSALIEISSHGQTIRIGRHVRPEFRLAIAGEIKRALRTR
jgi:uncharacterized membrane protein